jgi:hypothetical protein
VSRHGRQFRRSRLEHLYAAGRTGPVLAYSASTWYYPCCGLAWIMLASACVSGKYRRHWLIWLELLGAGKFEGVAATD